MILVSDDSKGLGGGRYSPLWEQALSCDQSPASRYSFALPRLASATGPSWAGPENIRSSNILSTSAASMVTRNLKTLGIPLARDFDLGSSIPYASQKFRMSSRVDRNTRCSNSSAARLSTAPRSAGTSSDWEPSAFETRAKSIGMCRKRSFGTGGRGRLPASAAVCRRPCLILCLAYVERVAQVSGSTLDVQLRSRKSDRLLARLNAAGDAINSRYGRTLIGLRPVRRSRRPRGRQDRLRARCRTSV